MLQNFTEVEAVALMLLGLRDSDAFNFVEYGVKKDSVSAVQLNPVDAVFRMAADMSGCFSAPRSLVSMPPPAAVLSTNAPASAGGSAISPDTDDLALRLRAIKISDDAAVLTDMSAKLKRAGIFALKDLKGLSLEELKEVVAVLSLNVVQLRRLFTAVSKSSRRRQCCDI
jgi:hypothetical protein